MKTKNFTQIGGREDGWDWRVMLNIRDNEKFYSRYEFSKKEYSDKDRIRTKDRAWVNRNIPSSIVWHTEIHHDWANNGTMYLLTKGEHILRHRSEKG